MPATTAPRRYADPSRHAEEAPQAASIIIPNLHSPHLGVVLDALRSQSVRPLEVIVVGQDRYRLAHEDSMVRIVATPEPVSPALARNTGIAYARGDICVFLDSDCVPGHDWLERVLERHWNGDTVVGGSIALLQQRYWERCDNIACLGAFLETAPPGERPYLLSGNMSIRTELIRRIGGFDPRLHTGEDVDLTFRLRAMGIRLYFEPGAAACHYTTRHDARSVWAHMYAWGCDWPAVADRHRRLIGLSAWDRLVRAVPPLAAAAIPALALRDAFGYYARQPELLRRHWPTIPGVIWARTGWYAGVMRGRR